MNYGMYLSANGASVQSRRLDVIANNIANGNTSGFKKDLAIFRANHPYDTEHGQPGPRPHELQRHTGGASLADVVTDFADGPLERTDNPFDVAVTGPGFLKVTDGSHDFLSRDGRLTFTATGDVVTRAGGNAVLGVNGQPVRVSPDAAEVRIGPSGLITEIGSDGVSSVAGQIGLFSPNDTAELRKVGHGLFVTGGRTLPAGPEVQLQQGYLEGSGTNPVTEMLAMIEASRGFETNVNMIKYQDEALGRLLQAVPR